MHLFAYDDSFEHCPVDRETCALLVEYATLLRDHGVESAVANGFKTRHVGNTEFADLAHACEQVSKMCRRVCPWSPPFKEIHERCPVPGETEPPSNLLIVEFAEVVSRHGVDSKETRQVYQQHLDNLEFVELADELIRLESGKVASIACSAEVVGGAGV